jgi:hypothetical protein
MKQTLTFMIALLIVVASCSKDNKAQKNSRDIEINFFSGGDSAIFTYTLPNGTTETIHSYGNQNNSYTFNLQYKVGDVINATAQTVNKTTQTMPSTQVEILQKCDCPWSGNVIILGSDSKYTYDKLTAEGVVKEDEDK